MNGWKAIAEVQYGVVTRTQLRAAGLSDRQIHVLVAGGTLERVHPAVFRLAGSYPSARQRAMAAALWCGRDALLSHGTASALLRLPGATTDLHITVPRRVKRV